MERTFESKAVRALERSESIRTTVPYPVAALLGLGAGDVIVWTVKLGAASVTVSRRTESTPTPKNSSRR